MRLSLPALAAAATLAVSSLAASATSFTFNYTTGADTASGSFDATYESTGRYLLTSISGVRDGISISSLAPVTFGNNDNVLDLNSPTLVDFEGISFVTADGTRYNVYASATGLRETRTGYDDGVLITDGSVNLAPVPEPSALALIGSGTLAAAGVMRRRMLRS